MAQTTNVGHMSAWSLARSRGYTGTREEYAELMASYATVAQQAAESAQAASSSAQGAAQAALNANTAMNYAKTAESNAHGAAESAQSYAQSAQQSAQSASQYAQSAESAKDTAVDAVDGFASGAQQALDGVNQAGNNWKSLAQAKALDSEAWAVGQRDGEDVGSSDPAYHNNAKYYAESVGTSAQTATDAAQTATAKAGEAAQSASQAAESARTLTIDNTLTQSGQAADAKETGDKITSLKEDLNDINGRFENPNVMDYSTLKYDNRFVMTTGQIRPYYNDSNSIIFAVEPNTTYYLQVVDGFNRRAMCGNDTGDFITNTVYTPIATTNDGTTGVIFTTPAEVTYVFFYFYNGVYTYDPDKFSLFKGNVLPVNISPTVKKSSLPSGIVYADNFTNSNMENTPSIYGYANYTKNHALTGSGSNFSVTEVEGVGVSDPIYGITGKPIRWYHGVNTLTSFTLWLIEYKADGSFNAGWGMLAGAEYRDIVSLKSDTAYIRCSFILNYSGARVQIANTESSSTVYWKPEYIGGINAGIVPEYYFNDQYLQSKCERINTLLKTSLATGDAFFFITDIHWDLNEQHSPALIQYIHDHTGINKIFDGGDRDDGYGTSAMQYELNAIRNSNVFPVVGNHEFLRSASRSEAFASAYQHIGNNVSWGEPGSFYYYYDNVVQKIRYIFLQSFNPSGTDAGAVNGYTENELTWFTGAMNVATGWTIVVVTHSLLIWNRDTKEPVTPTGITAQFVNAIESYEGNGTMACVIQGHIHGDWVYTLTNGIPIITTTCDKNDFYNESALSDVSRPSGTIDEQAFDVFIIDTENRNINAVRIGCAKDFVDDVTVQERTISY